ncbi:hypothetical protein C8R46DRAFT_623581 [Mycena filopes]|nr:hypothetical protein C8R46DRAFT_623581 [Mycena filopes]
MPDLPVELEREIFELAYNLDYRDRLSLCLVAHRVQQWIDVLFYKMVTFREGPDSPKADNFLRLVNSNLKPPGFFAAVKILCLTYSNGASNACDILAACSQVERLACWVDFGGHRAFPRVLSRLPLRRLSIELRHFFRIPLASPCISELTHLELVAWQDYDAASLSALAHLPSLTHVALNSGLGTVEEEVEHVAVVCSGCLHLQVLILIVNSLSVIRTVACDPRIVLQERLDNLVGDWEAPHFGLPDMWDRADAIAKEQRALTAP